jgi:glycosyltransferase involved in cell wall biosynthesis
MHWLIGNKRIVVKNNSVSAPSSGIVYGSPARVKLYILCYNDESYKNALNVYSNYTWAHPIRMKYQDASFENAFWKQLSELYDEWKSYDMVGTLSHKAYKKISLEKVDSIIKSHAWRLDQYYHFFDTQKPINLNSHPNMRTICSDIVTQFGLKLPTENYSNYWMCTPSLMLEFLAWYETTMRPYIFSHPLAMTDAKYKGSLSEEECLHRIGVPYYPHIPFVLERMNKAFFDKKISEKPRLLFVTHEFSLTGAPLALFTLGEHLIKSTNYNVKLISQHEFRQEMLTDPKVKAVIFNSLCTYRCIDSIKGSTDAKILWWIHEWPDSATINNYPWLQSDKGVYEKIEKLLFPTEKAITNFRFWAPWVARDKCEILTYGIKDSIGTVTAPPSLLSIIITIVGTIDRRKNQQVFIREVFSKMVKIFPHITLQLIGKKYISDLVVPKDISSNVVLIGEVKDVSPYLQYTDIHVSYSNNEVLPLNIIEAMKFGKPVLTTDVGGCSDLVVHNESGYIIPANSHTEAICYLSTLIHNEQLRNTFGARARSLYVEKYKEETAFQSITEYLRQL